MRVSVKTSKLLQRSCELFAQSRFPTNCGFHVKFCVSQNKRHICCSGPWCAATANLASKTKWLERLRVLARWRILAGVGCFDSAPRTKLDAAPLSG
jgi:hypothetical protein